jgi:hypothetical protein
MPISPSTTPALTLRVDQIRRGHYGQTRALPCTIRLIQSLASDATAAAIAGYLWVHSSPVRVSSRTAPLSSRACIRYPSNLISCSHSGPSAALSTSLVNCDLIHSAKTVDGEPRRAAAALATLGIRYLAWSVSRPRRALRNARSRTRASSTTGARPVNAGQIS